MKYLYNLNEIESIRRDIIHISDMIIIDGYGSEVFQSVSSFHQKCKEQIQIVIAIDRDESVGTIKATSFQTNEIIMQIKSHLPQYALGVMINTAHPGITQGDIDSFILAVQERHNKMPKGINRENIDKILEEISTTVNEIEINKHARANLNQFNQNWRGQLSMSYFFDENKKSSTLNVTDVRTGRAVYSMENNLLKMNVELINNNGRNEYLGKKHYIFWGASKCITALATTGHRVMDAASSAFGPSPK